MSASSPNKRIYTRPSNAKPVRKQGISIYRPFIFGSSAKPFDPSARPAGLNPEHTHKWTVYIRGVDGEDISYWLRKVQFKLHETYANSLRTVEAAPFEVTETGWGEFEVQIKLYFVPEAAEKPQTLWHFLKLHPWGPEAEALKERREEIVSQSYEEIIFNEPTEQLYEVMTTEKPPGRAKGSKVGNKAGSRKGERTAELPYADSEGNPYSQRSEGAEVDRLKEARKQVEKMIAEERARLAEREKVMEELNKKSNGAT